MTRVAARFARLPMIQPAARVETPIGNRTSRVSLTFFSCLWAAATLFHVASFNQWTQPGPEVFAAFWVLFQPGSTLALVTFAVLQIHKAFERSPYIPNHELFAALVNATLLVAVVVLVLKSRRLRIDRGHLFEAFAPAVRRAVLVLYFFAVFHKFNKDWFDPEVSCGAVFYTAELQRLFFLPGSSAYRTGAIYLSLGFEAVIPLLLLFRRTRMTGILVGAVFHLVLGLNPINPFYNFSAALIALFALFAAPGFVADSLDRLGRHRVIGASWALGGLFILGAFLSRAGYSHPRRATDLFLSLWTVYGAVLIALLVALGRGRRPAEPDGAPFFALPQPVLALLPLIVSLNGLMPYLGLKTETSWAMFSNLRTEGGASNHLLVPASLQVFGYQRDLVQVTQSSSHFLRTHSVKELVPYFEIRRRPRASVSYVRAGTSHTFKRAAEDPDFSRLPFWLAKLMLFRPVDTSPKQPCVH